MRKDIGGGGWGGEEEAGSASEVGMEDIVLWYARWDGSLDSSELLFHCLTCPGPN